MYLKIVFGFLICFLGKHAFSQEIISHESIEQVLPQNELPLEDDADLQSLNYFLKHRLDINNVEASELQQFHFLTTIQVAAFFRYREIAGKLLSVYELQAVPTWDLETIQNLIPFIKVGPAFSFRETMRMRLNQGEYTLLTRLSYAPANEEASLYPGGRAQVFTRFQYRHANAIQYGITGEKDAGEPWFKGKRRNGFDFYSGHFFSRKTGIVQALALGDYVVNIGQGLVHWQSMAFKKGADVLQIKRQSPILRPYHSSGEVFFQRGAGLTIGQNKWSLTCFYSSKKMDGTVVYDTITGKRYLLSWKTDGYHRSEKELDLKNTWRLTTYGGSFRRGNASSCFSVNAIHYAMTADLQKPDLPYHRFSFEGNSFTNVSLDWGITKRNIHWFGEAAIHNLKGFAFLNGLLASIDSRVMISLLWRKISPFYQSLFGNSFTETTGVSNENGLFAGLSFRPTPKWKVEAYIDHYRFPWLKYRKEAPTNGADYFIQLSHRIGKEIEIYSRYRFESSDTHVPDANGISQVIQNEVRKRQWRTQIQIKLNKSLTLRSRAEIVWVYAGKAESERGFLCYTDFLFKPMMKPYSAGFRWAFFETDSYESRIYAFENDVLFRFSIPSFAGKGKRYYLNLQYDLHRNISFWLRWSQTVSMNNNIEGTDNQNKPGINIQFQFRF